MARSAASSNCRSSQGDVPRKPVTTLLDHSIYSSLRSTDQSAAGLEATVRRLLVLSASLISFAPGSSLARSDLFALSFVFRKRLIVCDFHNDIGDVLAKLTNKHV